MDIMSVSARCKKKKKKKKKKNENESISSLETGFQQKMQISQYCYQTLIIIITLCVNFIIYFFSVVAYTAFFFVLSDSNRICYFCNYFKR